MLQLIDKHSIFLTGSEKEYGFTDLVPTLVLYLDAQRGEERLIN